MTHKVFVYGTLRRLAGEEKATHMLRDYGIYDAGAFPYIINDYTGVVYGNVIEVDDEQLAALDKYESLHAGLYTRESVQVLAIGGEELECFVYVGTDKLHPKRITSGDWNNR